MEHEERVVEHFVVAVKKDDDLSECGRVGNEADTQAELAFAYPEGNEDSREFCESVTMFMFPHSFGLDWNRRGLPPPPTHNLFALTDVNGDHLYGASLCFYETLQPSVSASDGDGDSSNKHLAASAGGAVRHQAKSICLLSKRPFYTQLLRYLEQLFLLGIQQSRVNNSSSDDAGALEQGPARWNGVEKTLCNIFHEVPVPYRGLAVQLSVADVEIVLERPLLQEFPFEMDAELMTYAFMMVDPKVMAQLYHHVLLEHRILVVGTDSVLVTAIAESIKCLVFPMTWLHVYIPNIPDSLDLSTLLEAPVPFIAGAHLGQLKHVHIPDNVVKLEFADGKFVLEANAPEVALPPLPDASHKVASKLATVRFPDFGAQKRELHDKLWDRRIQLQKCCMTTATASDSPSSNSISLGNPSSPMLSKSFFLVRQSLLYKKVMKLYVEIMAILLYEYPAFISNDGNQAAFESERFVERKPGPERAFYHEFVHTALFQSFIAQHNDHMSGSLPHDDAMKLQFVHRRLLTGVNNLQEVAGSASASSASKTFVAHVPQVPMLPKMKRKKSFILPMAMPSARNGSGVPFMTLDPVNSSICFPEVNANAFGFPRKIIFPTLSNDAATSSLGTFLHAPKTKQPSKDLGMEWMQQIMKNVSIPGSFKKPDFMKSDLPAAFKRSRTIDRGGRSLQPSPFYRTMTQRALDSTSSMFGGSNDCSHSAKQQDQPQTMRAALAIKSIWLVTTSACTCKDQVSELTDVLSQVLKAHEKNSSHASDAYCQLIDALGACGHPSEAKAVFEECLSGSRLLSLETIASQRYFWKPFSSLIRCYISNGLVQRAFDVMVQVKIEEEQHLDPSLGSLCFSAQVLSSENEVLVERIYTTFSCGNIGIYLAARETGSGAEVVAFESSSDDQDGSSDNNGSDESSEVKTVSSFVKENDVVETINGEMVLHYPLTSIVNCLKQAYRPMTITFLRGMAKLDSFNGTTTSTSVDSTANNSSPRMDPIPDEQQLAKFRPRKDLCDRFGFLPQKGIRITTVADCSACSTRASLSEIQEGWSTTDANDYTTRCSHCKHRYVPRLCVMLGVMTAFYQPAADAAATQVSVEQFEYLSMLVIRKELMNLSQKIPLTMLTMAELRTMNPRIYWNIVVKLLSLSCPLDFLDLPDMTKSVAAEESHASTHGSNDAEMRLSEQDPKNDNDDRDLGQVESDADVDRLQQLFVRTLRSIRSKQGSNESWERTASQVLARLAEYARADEAAAETRGASTTFTSTLRARDKRDGGDTLTDCDDVEERRSCRTLSVADSNCGGDDEDESAGADICGDVRSDSDSSLPALVENELNRMIGTVSSGSAAFQRKPHQNAR